MDKEIRDCSSQPSLELHSQGSHTRLSDPKLKVLRKRRCEDTFYEGH